MRYRQIGRMIRVAAHDCELSLYFDNKCSSDRMAQVPSANDVISNHAPRPKPPPPRHSPEAQLRNNPPRRLRRNPERFCHRPGMNERRRNNEIDQLRQF